MPDQNKNPHEEDDFSDYDDEDDEVTCEYCQGDGRDKWNDYLLPCPHCKGGA